MGEPRAVGLLGTGRLGAAVASRLLRCGTDLWVYNRDERKTRPLRELGAGRGGSPAEIASRCGTVLVCVSDGDAVDAVCCGTGGVTETARPGTVVVDLGTTGPDRAIDLHARLGALGIAYVECPVSGGPAGAEAGTLTALLGGDAEACRRVDPLVARFAGERTYLGAPGRAQVAKLVNNALESIHLVAGAQVVGMGMACGLRLEELRWVLSRARGGSVYAGVLLDYLAGRTEASGASLEIRRKDLRLALDATPETVDASLLGHADEVLRRSERVSGPDADQCECARLYGWPGPPGQRLQG